MGETRRCDVCATALDPLVRMCLQCKSWQEGLNCGSCGLPVPGRSERKAGEKKRPVPRCPHCKAFQDWRSVIPGSEVVLALVLSILSVIGAFGPKLIEIWSNRSSTSARVVDREPRQQGGSYLTVRVRNTGRRPSYVRGGAIAFPKIDLEAPSLTMIPADLQLEPGKSELVKFDVRDFVKKKGTTKTRDQVLEDLRTRWVKLTLFVDETDRWGDADNTDIVQEFKGAQIHGWASDNLSADPEVVSGATQ